MFLHTIDDLVDCLRNILPLSDRDKAAESFKKYILREAAFPDTPDTTSDCIYLEGFNRFE